MTTRPTVVAAALLIALSGVAQAAKKPAAKPKPKPKAPSAVANKGAGAQQIRALEGPLLATTFNNGGCQIKFSNLRQSHAWQDDGPGDGNHFILVDLAVANVTKGNISVDIRGRAADDAGKQTDDAASFLAENMLPASHANGTMAYVVPDSFTPTKLIMQFGYDLGDPIRAFLPKDYAWNKLNNVGPAGSPVDNGLASITAQIEQNPKLPSDWEAGEGNKYVVIAGRVTSMFSKSASVELTSLVLTSKDGQSFDSFNFISGQEGDLKPGGSRAFRVAFEVPQDAEPADLAVGLGYVNGVTMKITF